MKRKWCVVIDALDHDIPINQSIMNEIADTVAQYFCKSEVEKCR